MSSGAFTFCCLISYIYILYTAQPLVHNMVLEPGTSFTQRESTTCSHSQVHTTHPNYCRLITNNCIPNCIQGILYRTRISCNALRNAEPEHYKILGNKLCWRTTITCRMITPPHIANGRSVRKRTQIIPLHIRTPYTHSRQASLYLSRVQCCFRAVILRAVIP